MSLSAGLQRDAQRLVPDKREERRVRATALLLLAGPVKQWTDIEPAAARLGLANEFADLSGTLADVIENKAGQWTPKPANEAECRARLEQRILNSAMIWIIHGGLSPAWLEVAKYVGHDLGRKYVEFNDAFAKRVLVTDRVETMAANSDLAIAVMTAEDRTENGKLRARQNVVHEIGLAQGMLGWSGVILLREEGIEDFTNLSGLVYVPFPHGNVAATYGDLRAHIDQRLF
jgi:predicted nucleotide-binding protein